MIVAHLTASPFFGGPERQMLGLARQMRPPDRSVFLSFAEDGKARAFLDELLRNDFEAIVLRHNHPHLLRSAHEVAEHLRQCDADVLCCHGYKPNMVGLIAARRVGIPVVAVSRGWTGATWKVRRYEQLDRRLLRWMDGVACVSEAQARRVRGAGVTERKVVTIHNAIDATRFRRPDVAGRRDLYGLFAASAQGATPPTHVVCAAGRLSPEKGFGDFARAAALVARQRPGVGFVLFGDGPLRESIEQLAREGWLNGRFVLAGFRGDVDRLLPYADLMVLPSYTEGLPNVALEALSAGVPVVATNVGGTPEVVEDGHTGFLVPPGDPAALARRVLDALASEHQRRAMGDRGRARMLERFTFEAQAAAYRRMFAGLARDRREVVDADAALADAMHSTSSS